jgi:hypothetical protein
MNSWSIHYVGAELNKFQEIKWIIMKIDFYLFQHSLRGRRGGREVSHLPTTFQSLINSSFPKIVGGGGGGFFDAVICYFLVTFIKFFAISITF